MVAIYTSLLWLPSFQRIHVTFGNSDQSTGASMLHWCLLYPWRLPHVALESSRTDPYRQGCSLLIAPSCRSACAVRALRKYLSLRSVSGVSPLYVFHSGAYLTRAKVTSTLRTLLQRLSIPTELYASHSFRIGAATTAAGLPLLQVRCFKWLVVCSLNRTQGCRKQQQGYLFQMNAVTPLKTSQQAHARLVSYTWKNTPPLNFTHDLYHSCINTASCQISTQPLCYTSTNTTSVETLHATLVTLQ